MIPLARHAEELMDSAIRALNANGNVSDTTILVGQDGGIRVVDGALWPLHGVEADNSIAAAYCISNGLSGVTVEGRAGGRSCMIRTIAPAGAARILLGHPIRARTCPVESGASYRAI